MSTPTILFYPNKAKTGKRTKLTPVYIRIRNGKQKTERKLDVFISPNDLGFWKEDTQRLNTQKNRVNAELEKIETKFQGLKIITDENIYYKLSPDQIAEKILPGYSTQSSNQVSLISYVEDYYKNVITPSNSFKKGTKINYNKSINHLSNFLTFNGLRHLSLLDFCSSGKYAQKFKNYLTSNITELAKVGMSEPSAASIIKNIKPIINSAIVEGKASKSPFEKIKLKYKSPLKIKLTVTEVKSLKDATFYDMPTLEIYRDKFLFAIFTGLSYGDVEKLKRSDIIISKDGYYLDTVRKKTGFSVRQFLVDPAIEIYKKYENHIDTMITQTVLPTRHINNYNINLKLLAVKCKITKPLTTNIARHSCRQLLGNAGVADVPVQNCIMGWSERNTMSYFYNSVFNDKLIEARDTFNNYLKKHLS